MKFNFEDYKGDYAMHCKTEEEAKWFCKLMDDDGRKWVSGNSYLETNNWNDFKENTAYYFNKGCYGDINKELDTKYTILEASDFMSNQDKLFTKSDLKAGMLVEINGGDLCLLIPNQENILMFIAEDFNYITTSDKFKESLYDKENEYGIKRVYGLSYCGRLFDTTTRELLWKRKEIRKITHQEIRELLGEDFELID